MWKFNIHYSTTNTSITSEKEYIIQLISKVEKFIKQIRWRALQFLKKLDNFGKENYDLKTKKCQPCVDKLVDFNISMMKLIKKIEFRNAKCTFPTKQMPNTTKMSATIC